MCFVISAARVSPAEGRLRRDQEEVSTRTNTHKLKQLMKDEQPGEKKEEEEEMEKRKEETQTSE